MTGIIAVRGRKEKMKEERRTDRTTIDSRNSRSSGWFVRAVCCVRR